MKASMKAIPLEQFTIEITPPETRSSMLAISLYEDGKFNMNGKLSQILGRNKRTALGSEKIWDYAFNNILKKHVESGNIIDDEGIF